MNDNQLIVTNIQRMCFHDGPGIRTTVFLKGCNLHCPWCANPENIKGGFEKYRLDGVSGVYGRLYEIDELFLELMKDEAFWKSGGGVTFSGGEVLLHSGKLISLFRQLKEKNVHISIETALCTPSHFLEEIIDYVDYIIADVKILDGTLAKEIVGSDVAIYKKNVDIAYKSGKLCIFRMPCVEEYSFGESNLEEIVSFLKQYRDIGVEIFAIHNLGEKKYESLGQKCPTFRDVARERLESIKVLLEQNGVSNVKVISI